MALLEEDGLSFSQEHDEHHVCICSKEMLTYV